MRFDRIRIDAYGRLGPLDTGESPLPGLVVVHGPNEAGKSTFFHFLTTLLYGFYPASRDRNEYAPWSGEDASGSARIHLDAGVCAEVERRLLSSPSGRLAREGVETELRNQSLPWVTHVPRSVFGQVFALTLQELAALDEETWGRVQDRLLGSMGADLVPARTVAGDLEEEAGRLWRPNRRGKQEIRELREELRDLRAKRRSAADRDAALRSAMREREEAMDRLEEARREREEARLVVERIELLAPVRDRLHRIEELREEAGPPAALESLPSDPRAALAEGRRQIRAARERRAELERETAEPHEIVDRFGQAEAHLLERRPEVARFAARAASRSATRARLESVEQQLADLERRLTATAEGGLTTAWHEVPRGPLLSLSPQELRRRIRALAEARAAVRGAGSDAHPPTSGSGPAAPLLVGGLLVLAAGVSMVALAIMAPLPLAWLPGALALAAGAFVLHLWTRSAAGAREGAESATEIEALRATEDERLRELESLVRDIPVARDRLRSADPELVTSLERLQELVRDHQERTRTTRELSETLASADRDAAGLARSLGRGEGLDAEALTELLEGELHRAERLRDAAHAGERELARLGREDERVQTRIDELEARHDALEERLRALGHGEVEAGAAEARRRLDAGDAARRLQDELERSRPELEALRNRIQRAEERGDSWTRDDEALVRARTTVDGLTAEIEELRATAERLEGDLRHMMDQETMDAVDSEIAALQREESRLLDERDRRWILARLVREADRAFREEHQPDLLERAGRHLADLTDRRYTRLVADDGSGDHRFHLVGGDRSELTPLAPPLSTGTLEQAYLALRLAIIDHLDDGQERLPLFVDEALVNWDAHRRGKGLDLLAEKSRDRQIFVFTCHREMVRELEARGARRVELDAAGA